ncbi:hypothetical protein LAZ67_1008243 [Cordylochernes scorpioides]|uniref:Mos1 transposase HTH domain-containing protein n=1 Tax=Cordylochernes scorpioides TaxID=51811 RepID=A0ABY6K0Z0_9ARAC|nr:hypothetical protein LAZ67_1008243 [Cordylochernes scorpioides]
MSPKEIYEDMVDTLREDAPSYSAVKKWVAAFKLGRISTEDEHRPGRPVESVTQENIEKIHDLVMLDRRMTVRQIEETLGIPKTTVDRIMREHLGLRKLSACWVPKLLTPDQKAVRRKLSSDNLALFEANPEEFVNRFVTMDETWAHHFTPESKQQSMQWRHSDSPPPKKAKTVPSAGKVMVSVFWDSEGVLLLDFLNKGQTINGNYYANLVKQLREAIKEKRRGKLSRKIVYHQDNAPSHRSLQAMAAIYDSVFELLPHAHYSPDLAPSDFHLFPHLKKSLSGIHFRSDKEVFWSVFDFYLLKKMDQRTCIKFCVKNEIKCADAFRMLTVAYGEATLDRSNVYRWYKMFSEGREDVNDEERVGRPSTSTTDEKINEVEKMILANRRITVREVAEDLNISIGSCRSFFINDLGMRRVAAKFVPKLLNCDQKQHRMNIANEMLDSVRDDPNLLQRVITGDEAWVYGYDVETKAQSSQWKLQHEPRPKKARQVRSNVKVLLTVFFDCRGVVHHEFLPQGRTVNKEYCLQVMRNFREAIRQKRPDLW